VGKRKTKSQKSLREISAGGVVFKKENKQTLWLIVKPQGTDRWQLPKGKIEEDENVFSAAKRETEEEGGVEIKVIKKIGSSTYFYFWEGTRRFKIVVYFLMQYIRDTKKGHDEEIEETQFLPFEEALKKLTFKDDKKIMEMGKKLMAKGIQESLV
jgi:bis(5'-nucleosidyl)-tetraphosphatase